MPEAELAASYAHRREEFLRCARDLGWVGNPDEDVRAFGECYRRLAKELTDGEIALTPSTLTNASARMVEFVPGLHMTTSSRSTNSIRAFLMFGSRASPWMSCASGSMSWKLERRCPKGWKAALQDTSKYPVLRYRVGVIGGDLSAAAFDAVRPIVVEALDALSDLNSWWEQDGARLLPLSP